MTYSMAKCLSAVSHLRVAIDQTLPSDDQIIVQHMRDALAELELLYEELKITDVPLIASFDAEGRPVY